MDNVDRWENDIDPTSRQSVKTRLQKHGNLSELLEYLLGGTLRESA